MSLPDFLIKSKQKLGPAEARGISIGGSPQASSATLSFLEEKQQQDQWCWAAVTVSISHFYEATSDWTQCSLVNAELNRSDCCWNGSASFCNRPWTLDSPLTRTNNLNWIDNSAAGFTDVMTEINNGRPLGCRIGWFAGGGHFVVVHGYSGAAGSWVTVADPFYGPSTYAYDSFCTGYRNSGEWTHSYYSQS